MYACIHFYVYGARKKHEKVVRQDGFRMFSGLREHEMRSNPWNHNNARWPEYDFGTRKNMRKQPEGRIYHQCGGEYERK